MRLPASYTHKAADPEKPRWNVSPSPSASVATQWSSLNGLHKLHSFPLQPYELPWTLTSRMMSPHPTCCKRAPLSLHRLWTALASSSESPFPFQLRLHNNYDLMQHCCLSTTNLHWPSAGPPSWSSPRWVAQWIRGSAGSCNSSEINEKYIRNLVDPSPSPRISLSF